MAPVPSSRISISSSFVAVAKEDVGARRPRVLERVRQRLLHDPVGGDVDPGRKLHRLAFDGDLDRQPGCGQRRRELVDAGQARLRRERELLVVAPEHPEEPPHLGQRLLTRVLDRIEGRPRLVRGMREHPSAAPGLEHHHADPVCDDVVELPGDPCALLGDGQAGPFVSVGAKRCRLVLEVVLSLPARSDDSSTDERAGKEDREEGEVGKGDRLARLDRCQRDERGDEEAAEPSGEPACPAAGRVDGDDHSDQERAGLGQARQYGVVEDDHGEPGEKGRERRPSAKEQRGREDGRRRRRLRARCPAGPPRRSPLRDRGRRFRRRGWSRHTSG